MNELPRDRTIIPRHLRLEEDKPAVCAFLYRLKIPPLEKKLAFIMWCKMYQIIYDGSDVAKATGLPPGTL